MGPAAGVVERALVFDDTRRVLDLCHERGMGAILQLIGQNPSQEYMPDGWFEPVLLVDDVGNWS
jgi:hypothetical protein